MTLLYLALGCILIGLLGWVLQPLLQPSGTASEAPAGTTDWQDPEEAFRIQQLIDLEYDYQTGKISQAEYLRQRRELVTPRGKPGDMEK